MTAPTESQAGVVIPYSRFLERLEQRRRVTVEVTVLEPPQIIDAEIVPVCANVVSPATPLDGFRK